ncbi:type VII secretion-associated serine protease mycosin [Agreia bicolorata]|uniref:Type VII secretion-associated serine protease mycosin n=1 Tax=Agreia bicolorata TaxID=110935 RepID=A0A1T4YM94_9MICO|nr:S8 family serine peptidase [Agreia bicolorata]SKB02793.1 type VII secretion-associated serine protease mycosin [Agreia bicolorata]
MTRRRVAPRLRAVAVSAALATGILAAAPVGPVPTAQADTVRNAEYWLADYGVQAAWNTTRGAGVTVAVIDTGVDGSVADLAGVVTGGTDVSGVGSPNGQTPVGDENQHGTMVGSLIAGRGTGANDGVIGVAPEASLLSISVALGTGVVGTDDQIANAVRWAVDNGADVINMSLTRNSLDWPTSWDDAFLYAADHDVVVVAAAGNRGSGTTEVGAPATIPGVLTVAGVDRSGDASFDASSQGITIAVAAPSEQLVGVVPGGGYVRWAGTSGATPIVSGLVALVRAAHPDLDVAGVINRIVSTATPKGDPVPGPIYGYGLINAEAAVTADVPPVTANPMGSLKDWVATYRPSPDASGAGPKPIAAPETDDPAKTAQPTASWWPSVAKLTMNGIPIAVISVFLMLLAMIVTAAVVHVRRVRRRE